MISKVQAGSWAEIHDQFQPGDAEDWKESTSDLGPNGFVLRVSGPSMTNTSPDAKFSFPHGMLLYVRAVSEADPGSFVIVRRESEQEATFKRLVRIDGELFLEAINPDWPNRYLKLQEGDVICGVVKQAAFELP